MASSIPIIPAAPPPLPEDVSIPLPPPPPSSVPNTSASSRPSTSSGGGDDSVTQSYFQHSSGLRTNTDTVIAAALKKAYPDLDIVITSAFQCDLLGFAQSGNASFTLLEDPNSTLPSSLRWTNFLPPARRIDGGRGGLVESVVFSKFLYKWNSDEFIVYIVDGRDGNYPYGLVKNNYILTPHKAKADGLVLAAGVWSNELHDEIWVFDGGFWQKSRELFESVRNASWENVILEDDMKKSIIDDHLTFFSSRETYANLKVPWKRGLIYYGPPGNGKTISIKATMNMLYALKEPVPTLYVRTLTSYGGPEYSIKEIFRLARRLAPCYLVFEDLDTIVTDFVRSYFLNEVDGLKSNDGIFMVGSTNHLDMLDPGISKRPSRFDRKYLFPDPNLSQRIAYCQFWQAKLKSNKDIDFPDELCDAIANITDDFSFAYIQEAFVAALLAIARRSTAAERASELDSDDWVSVRSFSDAGDGDDLDKLVLWVEIKKQIAILREGMEDKKGKSKAAVMVE